VCRISFIRSLNHSALTWYLGNLIPLLAQHKRSFIPHGHSSALSVLTVPLNFLILLKFYETRFDTVFSLFCDVCVVVMRILCLASLAKNCCIQIPEINNGWRGKYLQHHLPVGQPAQQAGHPLSGYDLQVHYIHR
jgi:hypothetical protein